MCAPLYRIVPVSWCAIGGFAVFFCCFFGFFFKMFFFSPRKLRTVYVAYVAYLCLLLCSLLTVSLARLVNHQSPAREKVVACKRKMSSFIRTALNLYAKNAALGYAWIVISFDAWFKSIENFKLITAWNKWPATLQSLLFILYPAYFGYSSASLIASYDKTSFPMASRNKYYVGMIIFFLFGSYMGKRTAN